MPLTSLYSADADAAPAPTTLHPLCLARAATRPPRLDLVLTDVRSYVSYWARSSVPRRSSSSSVQRARRLLGLLRPQSYVRPRVRPVPWPLRRERHLSSPFDLGPLRRLAVPRR
jgi:hypothetical protein